MNKSTRLFTVPVLTIVALATLTGNTQGVNANYDELTPSSNDILISTHQSQFKVFPRFQNDFKENITNAIAEKDYEMWYKILSERFQDEERLEKFATKERFEKQVARYSKHEARKHFKEKIRPQFKGSIAVKEVIENNDYDAWVDALSSIIDDEEKLDKFATEERFEKIISKMADRQERRDHKKEILNAALNNDYSLWNNLVKEAVESRDWAHGKHLLEVVNEDNFDLYVEMIELKNEAKTLRDKANGIADQLGLEKPNKRPKAHYYKR